MVKRLEFKIGEKINRLTIIKETDPYVRKDGRGVFRKVLVKCDCGKIFSTGLSELKRNKTKSCSCFQKDMMHNRGKHWMSRSRFYNTFKAMVRRCNDINGQDYKDYGARGIKVEWNSFETFKKDMYKSYLSHLKKHDTSNTRIERIDNNGNYCKFNCKWATHIEQARNRRSNNLLTYKGKTQTLTEWANELGIKRPTLSNRINAYKWGVDKSLSTITK